VLNPKAHPTSISNGCFNFVQAVYVDGVDGGAMMLSSLKLDTKLWIGFHEVFDCLMNFLFFVMDRGA
jgi:hypothetical protein